MAQPEITAVLHDIGYRQYSGPRLGRGAAIRSLYAYSLRSTFGLGRGTKAKVLPFGVLVLCTLPALVMIGMRVFLEETPFVYREYPGALSMLLIVFLAAQAPELVSRDLSNHTLPLYFARPIRRADYALAKLAAISTALGIVLFTPMLIAYLSLVFTSDGPREVWGQTTALMAGASVAVLYAVTLGALALLIASLSSRRAFATGGIVAVFLAPAPISAVLSISTGTRPLSGLVTPLGLLHGLQDWAFNGKDTSVGSHGPLYALVTGILLLALAAGVVQRYRKVTA